jgi:hypothetical protein
MDHSTFRMTTGAEKGEDRGLHPAQRHAHEAAAPVDILTILFFAVAGFVVLCIAVLAYRLYEGTRGFEESGSRLEAQFEAEVMQSIDAKEAAPRPALAAAPMPALPPPLPPASPGNCADAPPAAATVPPPAAPAPSGPAATAAAEDAVAELVKRLRLLGIAAESEGTLALPLPPNGQIVRIRRGGLMAVLPRLEGEAFMAHLCRRFDMVAFPSPHGEPMVLQRMQTRAAELMPSLKE